MALQLNRLLTEGHVLSKLSEVHLPCWVAGSLLKSVHRLRAVPVHIGSSPHSGRYRALEVEDYGKMWWSDDGVVARPRKQ